jgi:lipoprotein-anchoring transpeptidase ErfK/SrfK
MPATAAGAANAARVVRATNATGVANPAGATNAARVTRAAGTTAAAAGLTAVAAGTTSRARVTPGAANAAGAARTTPGAVATSTRARATPTGAANAAGAARTTPAAAATSTRAVATTTIAPGAPSELSLAQCLAWQAALDRAGFSPGILDGRPGAKTDLATREFQRIRRLPITGKLDAATAQSLGADPARAATWCTITPADVNQVGRVPAGWVEKSKLSRLPYPSLDQLVAERYHCSRALLATLNPGRDLGRLSAGDKLIVPLVGPRGEAPPADRLDVDTAAKVIRAFAGDRLVGLFHCSIAARHAKVPTRPASVTGITENPTYRFDPSMWPEVKGIGHPLIIPPGPRNPVGLCWIALSLSGYGMHGSPAPEMIGKTGSHGCFRMTNWDALRLARMIKPGTPVTFSHNGR